MIASGIQQLGWTKLIGRSRKHRSSADCRAESVHRSLPRPGTSAANGPGSRSAAGKRPASRRRSSSLAALAQTVDRLAAAQDQMARAIDRLQAADQEILARIPSPLAATHCCCPRGSGATRPPEDPAFGKDEKDSPTLASLPVGHAATEVALRASCGPHVQRLCRGISWENGGVISMPELSSQGTSSPTCDTYFNQMPVHPAAQKGAPKATSPNPGTPPPSRKRQHPRLTRKQLVEAAAVWFWVCINRTSANALLLGPLLGRLVD